MVSKCANPACSAPFHYLREGKVFRLEIEERSDPRSQLLPTKRAVGHVEYFWLCGSCALILTLRVNDGKVITVPLQQAEFRRAAAS